MWCPEAAANAAAIAGPGAIERPAIKTESCQTDVKNRTFPSRNAAKAAEKNSDARFATVNERTRTIAGSMTGERCV